MNNPTISTAPPKTVLITGAAKRIGNTIAQFLHAQGMNVIIHYRTAKSAADILCTALNKSRPNSAISLYADLAHFPDLALLIEQATQAWGSLDVLINNASAFYPTPIALATEAAWDDLLNTNLKAPFFLSQLAAPYLKQRAGCIVNISDIHADKPLKQHPLYSISKAGLNMLTYTLAKELAPDVRVNAIAPGAIIWPEGKNTLNPSLQKEILSRIPLGHEGSPSEIAKTAWFLIESAQYVTGQILAVDGGRLLNC
jgi:pteridine reductase